MLETTKLNFEHVDFCLDFNIMSGNFKITMKESKDLKAEVSNLKDSLEFTENVIEKIVEKLETELDNLEDKVQDIWGYQIDPDYIQLKLIELIELKLIDLDLDEITQESMA